MKSIILIAGIIIGFASCYYLVKPYPVFDEESYTEYIEQFLPEELGIKTIMRKVELKPKLFKGE